MRKKTTPTLSLEEREALFDELEASLSPRPSLTVRERLGEPERPSYDYEGDRTHKTPEEIDQEIEQMCAELLADCGKSPASEKSQKKRRSNPSAVQPSSGKNAAEPEAESRANSGKITKFGTQRKRVVKLSTPDDARNLVAMAMGQADRFGAIWGTTPYSPNTGAFVRRMVKDWLKSRYWGQAMILDSTHHLPPPDSLPDWNRLPSDVAQFFKLIAVLHHPDAIFATIRLDIDIGERAIHSKQGPCSWLAERITRALASAGIDSTHMAFSIEFAPKQAKTIHKLHIHGALHIPAHLREQAKEALKQALAPQYVPHGTNKAIHIEEPHSAPDVARYIPKDEAPTQNKLKRLRRTKAGSGAHRSTSEATRGGQHKYSSIKQFVSGNPFLYAELPDFS
ncbi:hypothetical protein IM687_00575 [Stutzerimonas stutzeri]|uniref:hypothetical protein n=1 Tax=Stutzerimonas stutzeri TaxID=316 RepID=UPI0018AC0519|nr:hypothetical protein [Stutzerimonas stutzeri]QPI09745.1 hypothetical protein IM687_00575 [Stutzerimonas stutzeri]